jgi:gliding motility-associated-like protein
MANGNQALGTNYNLTKCGLNYTTASAVTGQRPPVGGQVQPVALNIAGIPAGATIEAAFLYTEGSGNGAAQTATIAGPLGTAAYPMTLIGSSSDKCWGYSGSHSYRADVTASVNGNGTYNVSGLLVDPALAHTNDMDGCSLVVIYSQTGQLWTGTLIINDGALEGGIANPQNTTQTITYPAICGPTSNGSAFMGIGDLQPNVAQTATLTFNGTPWPLSSDWWDLASVNTTYTAGQTFTDFNVNSTNSGDCWNICFIGVYWQNISCAICTPPIVDLDSTATPASCDRCNGTATIIATGSQIGYTYLWSTGDTTPTITNLCAGTYSVTVQSGPTIKTATVTVLDYGHQFSLDTLVANPKCYGSCDGHITVTPTANATPPFTYVWSPTQPNTGTITGLCQGTFIVTVSDSFHCSFKDTFILTQPGVLAGPNTTQVEYCQFETTVPLVATPTNAVDSLVWYTQPVGGVGTTTVPIPSSAVAGTFIWYVSERDSTGCESVRVPTWVYIKYKPTPPVTFTSEYDYCQFDTATQLTAIGDSLKWYTTATGGSYSYTAPLPSTASLGFFTWYVSQTVNGCESDRIPISVGVYVKPAPPITVDIIYCQGDTASPLTAIGSDLHWYLYPYGGSPQPVPTPITTIPDTVTWYVSSNNHGCESDRTPLKVITHYRPTVHILYSNDSVCQFDTLTYLYSGNAQDSAKFYWEWPEGAHVLSGNDSTRGPIVVQFDSTGLKYVSLTVTDNGCTGPRVSVPVRVKVLPVVNIKMSARDACKDDTITVGIDYANMQIRNFWWNFDGGITPWGSSGEWGADGGGPYYITWPTMGIHSVTLHVQGVNMCYSRPDKIDTVNLHDRPEAKILPGYANNICSGDSIRLEASTNLAGYSYQWAPKQFFDDGDNTSVVNGYVETTKYISLTVTNEFGCKMMDSVLITTKPCCEIFLPDAFSPNGDGKNDLFRVVDQGRHPLTDFRVFNRWGEIVFNTADPKQGWDGSHEGVAQDIGVYYYIVKFKCDGKLMTKTGEVTLIR